MLCGIEIDGKRFWRMKVIVWADRCKVEIKEGFVGSGVFRAGVVGRIKY